MCSGIETCAEVDFGICSAWCLMSAGIVLLSQENKVQELVCKMLDAKSGHLQSIIWPVLLGRGSSEGRAALL